MFDMNLAPQTQEQQAEMLHGITHFIWLHRGKAMAWADTYERLFRYVAFCFLSGKLTVNFENGEPVGCVFHWADWTEYIEAKAAEGRPQFEWIPPHKGDALFVGDCIGTRHSIGRIYHDSIAKWPNLMITPIYTLRKGKLVRISHKILNRFSP